MYRFAVAWFLMRTFDVPQALFGCHLTVATWPLRYPYFVGLFAYTCC